jgi:hypothetical protein
MGPDLAGPVAQPDPAYGMNTPWIVTGWLTV